MMVLHRDEQRLRCTKEPFVEKFGPRKIKSVRFVTLSGPEIRKAAEVEVFKGGSLYDLSLKPTEHGLLDSRMGAANKSGQCSTCHGIYADCPGHFGYLKLERPVFNVGFHSAVLDILKCICKHCSRILLSEHLRLQYLARMRSPGMDAVQKSAFVKTIRDKCKTSVCPWCRSANGVVKRQKPGFSIIHDLSKTTARRTQKLTSDLSHKEAKSDPAIHILDPIVVLKLFERMCGEDCELLNCYDRPEKLLLTEMAVPPSSIRPSSFVRFGQSNEDSITALLKEIVFRNSILKYHINKGDDSATTDVDWGNLQNALSAYINSDSVTFAKNPSSGLVQRLKGKQGRFRGNLSGKRAEFTGRTVISPDPNLKVTEVAIPVLMARVLTYPEKVSSHNIEKLRQRLLNGPYKHPGANFILLPDGTKKHLKYVNKNVVAAELKCGDIVERHLEDGDIVLFNRQPSLHRMSIMCHRARIMPWRTLRFNESVCNPYNADFDGDEMNLHVPQTEEARTEALMLMGVQNNLCTPKNGEILIASTQDFLTSSFSVTRKDTFYDRTSVSLMCSYMGDSMDSIDLPTPALLKPFELWTGKQLFSIVIRPNAKTKVFINLTVKEKNYTNNTETRCPRDGFVYFRNSELLCGQLGKVTLGNGNKDGLFSVLLRDYNSHAAASCMNRLAKFSARWIGNHGFSIGIDDVAPGKTLNQRKKETIENGYKSCHELISSYSEGKLQLIAGCTPAETLEAKISDKLNKIREAAADVCKEELHWRNSPLIMSQCGSKGSPINISQMIACVGQQSVGGHRAPDGFINRTLPHFPIYSKEPAAKGFVANSFYSGLKATEFFFHTMGGREGLVDTAVKTADTGYMSRRLVKGLEDIAVFYDQTVRNASGGIIQFNYGEDGLDPAKMEGKDGMPINMDQLFMKVMATCPPTNKGTLSPSQIEKFMNDSLSKLNSSTDDGCSVIFMKMLEEFLLKRTNIMRKTRRSLNLPEDGPVGSSTDSTVEEKFASNISGISLQQLQVFLDTCISRYHRKKVESATPIGVIGAQSIGEPGTQMTLKTFHFAGVASMNITLGVPRIKEIINASKTISTPIISVKLACDNHMPFAQTVRRSIQRTLLSEVAKSIKIVLAKRPTVTVKLDMEQVKIFEISSITIRNAILNHPKLKLNPQNIHVNGDDKLIVHPTDDNTGDALSRLNFIKNVLPKVIVKGIPTIERVIVKADKNKENKDEFYELVAEGTNLLAVLGTSGVNGRTTKTNHILEVHATLGIEAARRVIIDEIHYTMKGHGMSIDKRHMMLLADLMTFKGEVLGITRFGFSKMKDSVLMLASFEKTADHLFNASYCGREDPVTGVSECVILGTPMSLGTGMMKIQQKLLVPPPKLVYEQDPMLP